MQCVRRSGSACHSSLTSWSYDKHDQAWQIRASVRVWRFSIVCQSVKFKGAASVGLPGFAAIILAAGEGSRLNSARPKVLHEIAGQTMIRHVIAALRSLEPAETVVVIGRDMDAVARTV